MQTTQTNGITTLAEMFEKEGERMHILARETVYHAGSTSNTVYFIHKGKVKLSYLHPSGKRITLGIRAPGDLFGEMALVGEQRRRHHAEALEDGELHRMNREVFLVLARRYQSVYPALLEAFGRWVQELEEIVEDLAFRDIQGRLSRQLLRLSDEYGVKTKNGILIGFRLTHRDLAEMIGSARENTTVVLNRFEKEGILDKRRYQIVIKDLEGLKEKSQG